MANRPYIIHDDAAMHAIAASLSPTMDLNVVQEKLLAMADQIKVLSIEHPKRQLLAAIRIRQLCIANPFFQRKEQYMGLDAWLSMQRSCPLNA